MNQLAIEMMNNGGMSGPARAIAARTDLAGDVAVVTCLDEMLKTEDAKNTWMADKNHIVAMDFILAHTFMASWMAEPDAGDTIEHLQSSLVKTWQAVLEGVYPVVKKEGRGCATTQTIVIPVDRYGAVEHLTARCTNEIHFVVDEDGTRKEPKVSPGRKFTSIRAMVVLMRMLLCPSTLTPQEKIEDGNHVVLVVVYNLFWKQIEQKINDVLAITNCALQMFKDMKPDIAALKERNVVEDAIAELNSRIEEK
jgi:hypothetical protein